MARTRTRRGDAGPTAPDENTLNLRELVVFLEDAPGFRLGLATYDHPETREAILERLAGMVADRPIHLTRLDLTRTPDETALLDRLQQHLRDHPAPEGTHPAVMVVGLESAIDFHLKPDLSGDVFLGGPLLHNANLQRDAFPRCCPVPVVLWLNPWATTAFAQSAPDLWHWRTGSFTFAGSPEGRRKLERALDGNTPHRDGWTAPRAQARADRHPSRPALRAGECRRSGGNREQGPAGWYPARDRPDPSWSIRSTRSHRLLRASP